MAKAETEAVLLELEKAVMLHCYSTIGVDFPDRGFLLFWQLPLDDKMKYFEIEPDLESLTQVTNKEERQQKLDSLLAFLGSNPVQKVDLAFKAKHHKPLLEYLQLES